MISTVQKMKFLKNICLENMSEAAVFTFFIFIKEIFIFKEFFCAV